MITHLGLIGDDVVTADVQPGVNGQDPVLILRLGNATSVSMSTDLAQYTADAILDALADTEGAAGGPVPYVPMWHPV